MALQQTLPGEIVVKTRDEVKADYLRSYRIRNPEASIAAGEQPEIDASVLADVVAPLYANAKIIGAGISLQDATGARLEQRGAEREIPKLGAFGATGFVEAETSVGGSTIFAGDEIRHVPTGLRFECSRTDLYNDGDPVPINGIDTGPQTNLPADTELSWSNPRPGCGQTALVQEQSDGSGLKGGRDGEEEEPYRNRLIQTQANQANSGNDSEIALEVERVPGIPVEKCFTYPGINGPGTHGVVFTMKPAAPGASRLPSAADIAAVSAHVIGLFPGDDGFFFGTLDDQQVDIVLRVEWAAAENDWVDAVRWPPYYAAAAGAGPGAIVVDGTLTPTATVFKLKTNDADYTGVAQPANGQTIGFYDRVNRVFRRKRILSFVGTGPWTITCDTTNAASDVSYTQVADQRAMPWSESLDVLVAPILVAFGALGPGEQRASFFDEGLRERRQPQSPKFWPHVIARKALDDAFDLPEVFNGNVVEGADTATTVGSPGTLSNLIELGRLSAFPL